MTQNQIKYQQLQEDKRSNLVNEAETERSHRANEAETNRSNVARETETHRSNVANEQLTAARDAETKRSNLARELETNRHNVATEYETHRSNTANETLKKYDTDQRTAASIYSADRSYQGRVDSAYINQWGISPSDIKGISDALSPDKEKAIDRDKIPSDLKPPKQGLKEIHPDKFPDWLQPKGKGKGGSNGKITGMASTIVQLKR